MGSFNNIVYFNISYLQNGSFVLAIATAPSSHYIHLRPTLERRFIHKLKSPIKWRVDRNRSYWLFFSGSCVSPTSCTLHILGNTWTTHPNAVSRRNQLKCKVHCPCTQRIPAYHPPSLASHTLRFPRLKGVACETIYHPGAYPPAVSLYSNPQK